MSLKIAVAGLTKRYGARLAVDGVDFEIEEGQIFGLLGPNGAGKTTILECLCGLRKPDGGSIEVDGVDARAEPVRARSRLGVALQATELQDRITPREALRLFGAFHRDPAPPDELIARFSLQEKADAPYASLSAGQRQRLALALAFVHRPEILLLDEPTAGLDPRARRGLQDEIRALRAAGRTVLLTTHALDEAHALCDRVAILRDGRIVATGRPQELIARQAALPVVTLRTAAPVAMAELEGLEWIIAAEALDGGVRFRTREVGRAVAEVAALVALTGNELLDVDVARSTLEEAFVELTRPESGGVKRGANWGRRNRLGLDLPLDLGD